MTSLDSNTLIVATNRAAGADIHGIKGPVHIAGSWWWLLWAAVGAAVLAVLFFGLRYWRKRKQAVPATPAEPVVAPEVRARAKLEEALGHLEDPRVFCILVSDAVRFYLEERFELRAPERTTEEFLDELQTSAHLNIQQKAALGGFLQRCDLAKFARYPHGPADLRAMYDSALQLIEETTPPPVAQAEPVSTR